MATGRARSGGAERRAPAMSTTTMVAAVAAAAVLAAVAVAARAGRRHVLEPGTATDGGRARRVRSLLCQDESIVLEFKSWPASSPKGPLEPDNTKEKIVREMCSLVNTKGGDLLIGVGDDGRAEGLAPNGSRLSRKERDKMTNWIANVIASYFGVVHDSCFDYKIVEVDGLDILHCAVTMSKEPMVLRKLIGARHDFFIRAGSTCRPLGSKDMLEYAKKTWPEWFSRA